MPATFTRSPAGNGTARTGNRRQAPVSRRPTGGGGNGDDDWKNHRRGPRERLQRIRTFVLFGLAGDMMFFAVLVVLFFARQAACI